MEFVNHPQKLNSLRTDSSSCLKGENGKCISIKIKENSNNYRLVIRLTLKSIKNHRHFFRLFRLEDKKTPKEETSSETEININENTEDVELNFFGIRRATKEQAMKFIRDSFTDEKTHKEIYKQNSSVFVLEISLYDQETDQEIHHLTQEIHVGNPSSEKIEVFSYTPKTLYDDYDGEITFCVTNKIKDDNNNMQLKIENLLPKYIKKMIQPAKKVYVFKILLKAIPTDTFAARLYNGQNYSSFVHFNIRRSEPEKLKNKSSSVEEWYSDNRIGRTMSTSQIESNVVDINSDKKRRVNDILTTKLLREIAKVGHDFAFGKEITDRMKNIMNKFPVVCILQDDVGDTPLNNAILKNNEDRASILVDIILKNFPNEINLSNTSGHTPLILSPACDVSVLFIQKLIDCGANLMAADSDGNTALNIAIMYKKLDIFMLLVNAAKSQNFFKEMNEELILLLKDTLNKDFFDGFQILASSFSNITDYTFCESILDINQLIRYIEYMDHFNYLPELQLFSNDDDNNLYFTPTVENNTIDDGHILDWILEDELQNK